VKRPLPAAVIALGITSFLTDASSEMIFPLLPVFVASLGASPVFLGVIEGIADATSSLLKLASGHAADRMTKRKPIVLLGYGIASVVRPLMALATAPWHVLAVRVTDRVGKGIRSAPRDAIIASSVPKEDAGRAFGAHMAMDHAGAVVGPLVATALLALGWELRSIFWLAMVPGMLSVLAVLSVRETRLEEPPPSSSNAAVPRESLPASLKSYFAILLLFSLGNSSDAFLLLRAKDLGVDVKYLPLLWVAFHLVKLGSAMVGGAWSDRMPRHRLIIAGWIVYAATYMAFGFATSAWHAWVLLCVYGIYHGLTEPVEKAIVKDLAPPSLRGRAYGIYAFIIGISAIPAGALTGWLWQSFGPVAAFTVGAAIAGVSSLMLSGWSRRFRRT
jgi:MFS family permease